jgi:hypothetical protein
LIFRKYFQFGFLSSGNAYRLIIEEKHLDAFNENAKLSDI